MSMFPPRLERMDDKLDALQTALAAAIDPGRTLGLGLVPYALRSLAELQGGVWNLVAAGEGEYSQAMGMAAKEGTLRVLLIGHIQVDESDSSAALQQAEIGMAEEIKAFIRAGMAGATLSLERIETSRLTEHPYGWAVAFIEMRPPAGNTH